MENFSGFQSVYIPLTSGIAAESYGQTVLFLSKEKTSHAKWRLSMRHFSIHVRNIFK